MCILLKWFLFLNILNTVSKNPNIWMNIWKEQVYYTISLARHIPTALVPTQSAVIATVTSSCSYIHICLSMFQVYYAISLVTGGFGISPELHSPPDWFPRRALPSRHSPAIYTCMLMFQVYYAISLVTGGVAIVRSSIHRRHWFPRIALPSRHSPAIYNMYVNVLGILRDFSGDWWCGQ